MSGPVPSTMGPSMPMGGSFRGAPPTMPGGMPPMGSMGGMPPMASMAGMGPGPMQSMAPMGGAPFGAPGSQYMPNVSRPAMTSVANPPVVANNMQYGPSYKMQYAKRSTADKTAVKYTGFLPLEGVYEEDTCRIG